MSRAKTTASLAELGRPSTRGRPGVPNHTALSFAEEPIPNFGAGLPCQARDVDPDLFFPKTGRDSWLQVAVAKQLCARCPVIVQCGAWAVQHGELGIWGGLTENDRGQLRNRQGGA